MFQIWETRAKLKRLKPKVGCWSKHKFTAATRKLTALEAAMAAFDKKHGRLLSDRCEGAFVTFNCEDSRAYCLEDYANSTSGFSRWLQVTVHFAAVYRCTIVC